MSSRSNPASEVPLRKGVPRAAAGDSASAIDAGLDLPGSERITRASKSNLALSFSSLPKAEQRSMTVFYAFCRVVDDISDSEVLSLTEKQRQLNAWRNEIALAYVEAGEIPRTPLGKELAQVIRTYHVPVDPLNELLNGVEMDLTKVRYANFQELALYCYRVASAVGLVSIRIFGCTHPRTTDFAIALGMAFQLTNILRDVKKDASLGRIYLPLDELSSFGVTEEDILKSRFSEAMRQFVRFQHHRARHYFAQAHRLVMPEDRAKLVAAEVMREVYEEILNTIEKQKFDNISRPVRFGKFKKVALVLRALAKAKKPSVRPPVPKTVLVLGGGYAGLSAAAELVLRGHHVTVLESRAILGGRSHSFTYAPTGQVLDNGQHVLMGCYHQTLRLIEQMGVRDRLSMPAKLDVPFRSARGSSSLTSFWPEPFHLLSALLGFKELTAVDKWAAVKFMGRLKFGFKPTIGETVSAWLLRCGQTDNLIRALWEPLCLAALNEPCLTASAHLFAEVIRRSFLAGADDPKIVFSRVGLSDLFAPEIVRLLEMCGSQVRRQCPVKALHFKDKEITGVEINSGEILTADMVVSALPWHVLRHLVPTDSTLAKTVSAIRDSPIVSLHLWLDREVLPCPFIGFLDSPVHWVFSREQICKTEQASTRLTPPAGYVMSAVISGARDTINSSSEHLVSLVMTELTRFVPEANQAKVLHHLAYKAQGATFLATPAVDQLRPEAFTEWRNFVIAGDWTQTQLPATIESAVMSGRRAAQSIDSFSPESTRREDSSIS